MNTVTIDLDYYERLKSKSDSFNEREKELLDIIEGLKNDKPKREIAKFFEIEIKRQCDIIYHRDRHINELVSKIKDHNSKWYNFNKIKI